MAVENAIATDHLTKRFGNQTVVDGLTLDVEKGTVFGFLGRNGAGKTTTIKMLMNLISPSSGSCRVLGLEPQSDDIAMKRGVGYVGETPMLYGWMKVREIVWFTAGFYDNWDAALVDDLLAKFGLDPEAKVKNLSRGMNAQLALALAMGHRPPLLILDEPATGLDVLVRRDFLESIVETIQGEGRTVFLSSHLVHEVERVADRVAILDEGKLIVCDDVDAIKQTVKKVLVRTQNGASNLIDLAGVTAVQGDGEQRMLTVMAYDDEKARAITDTGCQIVEVMDLSLEECFIEYVRPGIGDTGAA